MRVLLVLLLLIVVHTSSLWNPGEHVAGGFGDPFAHAAIPEWYCNKVLKFDFYTDRFLAPTGVSLANSYDSPFPMILTCPFQGMGTISMFHLFATLQVLLIVLMSWLVARTWFPRQPLWQLSYVLFAWWSGFYFARVHQHLTLLSGLWGTQALLYLALTFDPSRRARTVAHGALAALVFAGTFHNVAVLSAPAAALFGFALWQKDLRRMAAREWFNLVLAGVVFLAVYAFLFGPAVAGYFSGELSKSPADRGRYNLDLLSLFIPWSGHLIYSWLDTKAPLTFERFNQVDPLILAAFVAALFHRPLWRDRFNVLLAILAALSWVAALGPELRLADHVLASNPLEALIGQMFPFSISRTPARFASVTGTLLTVLTFRWLFASRFAQWRALPALLIAWIVVSGPVLNQVLRLPTFEYRSFFPMAALEEVRRSPFDEIVVNIPVAISSDPTQNFMQIFHGKRITTGYIAYAAYTESVLQTLAREPVLSQLNCGQGVFEFRGVGPIADWVSLRQHLLQQNFRYLSVNRYLLGGPDCQPLVTFLGGLMRQPWIRTVGESEGYTILAVQ